MSRDAQELGLERDVWLLLVQDIASINAELAPICGHVAGIPTEVVGLVVAPEDVFGAMSRIQEKVQGAVDGIQRVQEALVRMCELVDGRATMLRAEEDEAE